MNYLLILAFLVACGGVYYEHSLIAKTHITDDQKNVDLVAQVEKLQADNQKLTEDKTKLVKRLTDDEAQLASLYQQIQSAPPAVPSSNPASPGSQSTNSPYSSSSGAPVSDELGTLTTLDGKTYEQCKVLKAEQDGITISSTIGITKVMFAVLPPEIQKRFGYDPQKALGQ